ncbi:MULTISPECIES: pitrilysin family protein [unclassified Thioalkalivibrio]|uniref:M16 family metallopeptidase n=1 Tax=unclassified Thioalkalivibrio TaxID=2621013 RepID=UPI00036D2605|nr:MULTISPECIES: pitrilysin family protein [unclassified Thioalkalivibrio]
MMRAGWLTAFVWLLALALPAQAVEIEQWETDEGLRVLYVAAPDLPMVDLRLTFDGGASRDGDHHGLASLTSSALRHGTEEMDSDELAERFESVGAQFSTDSLRDMAIVSLRSLTEPDWMNTAVETLTAVLAAPAFPEADFERARRQALQGLQRERQDPGSVASRRFYELMYGDHPYANWPGGKRETLEALAPADARAFYERFYTTGNGALAITGGLTREEAEAVADRISAALPQGAAAEPLPAVEPRDEPVEERIEFPSEQAHILMGAPALRRGDEDHYALTLANHAFGGGGFTSRLFREIRSQRGLAYSVSSRLQPMAAEGPFRIGMQTGVDQADEAVTALREALVRWHADGVDAEELEASRENVVNSFPLSLASNSDIVGLLGMMAFYDLPLDYLERYIERMEAVELDELNARLRERINPDAMVTVIVGGQE